jgi:hypothetical protein
LNLYGKGSKIACNRPDIHISDMSLLSVDTAGLQVNCNFPDTSLNVCTAALSTIDDNWNTVRTEQFRYYLTTCGVPGC